jgi:hypothetical protein
MVVIRIVLMLTVHVCVIEGGGVGGGVGWVGWGVGVGWGWVGLGI